MNRPCANFAPIALSLALAVVLSASSARAEETKKKLGWADVAELSAVMTNGNSEGSSFAVSNKLSHAWENADFDLAAGLLRAESTTRLLSYGVDEPVEDNVTSTTAERYFAEGKYSRQLSGVLRWYALAGWFKNELAGFDSVVNGGAGLAYIAMDSPQGKLLFEVGVGVTKEKLINDEEESFAELRGFAGYERQMNSHTKVQTSLEALQNLNNSDDMRLNYLAAVTASLSERLALKLAYNLRFDNDPVTVLVLPASGAGDPQEFAFDEADQTLTAALVVNF